jgi:hypothetical protein
MDICKEVGIIVWVNKSGGSFGDFLRVFDVLSLPTPDKKNTPPSPYVIKCILYDIVENGHK